MENRSGETNNPQNSAENAFDYAAADITNELPRGDTRQANRFNRRLKKKNRKSLTFSIKSGA